MDDISQEVRQPVPEPGSALGLQFERQPVMVRQTPKQPGVVISFKRVENYGTDSRMLGDRFIDSGLALRIDKPVPPKMRKSFKKSNRAIFVVLENGWQGIFYEFPIPVPFLTIGRKIEEQKRSIRRASRRRGGAVDRKTALANCRSIRSADEVRGNFYTPGSKLFLTEVEYQQGGTPKPHHQLAYQWGYIGDQSRFGEQSRVKFTYDFFNRLNAGSNITYLKLGRKYDKTLAELGFKAQSDGCNVVSELNTSIPLERPWKAEQWNHPLLADVRGLIRVKRGYWSKLIDILVERSMWGAKGLELPKITDTELEECVASETGVRRDRDHCGECYDGDSEGIAIWGEYLGFPRRLPGSDKLYCIVDTFEEKAVRIFDSIDKARAFALVGRCNTPEDHQRLKWIPHTEGWRDRVEDFFQG